MRIFHIIEQTADQQTMEIRTCTMEQAIKLYAHTALVNEPIAHMEYIDSNTIRIYAKDEHCTVRIHSNGRIAYAHWTHNNGLY